MGLSISYDRAIQLEDQLAISACERFKDDDVVIPACLRKGLFTVGALDNLDHNPTSTTSSDSFHGTGISLFQIPKQSQTGERRPSLKIPHLVISKIYLTNTPLSQLLLYKPVLLRYQNVAYLRPTDVWVRLKTRRSNGPTTDYLCYHVIILQRKLPFHGLPITHLSNHNLRIPQLHMHSSLYSKRISNTSHGQTRNECCKESHRLS